MPRDWDDYEAWLERVEDLVLDESGCYLADLPDYDYIEAYEDGLNARQTANAVLEENGFGL